MTVKITWYNHLVNSNKSVTIDLTCSLQLKRVLSFHYCLSIPLAVVVMYALYDYKVVLGAIVYL